MTNPQHFREDDDITIALDDLRLVAAPYGASLRGLEIIGSDGRSSDIATGYRGASNKIGGQGDVLIPFPGRIAHGRYDFDGQTHQLVKNDEEGPSAIHGFVRSVFWEASTKSDRISFSTTINETDHPGYPFALEMEVTYRLDRGGMTVDMRITNSGSRPAPVAAGFHPYFTVGSDLIDGDVLHVPFSKYLEFGDYFLPTGRVLDVAGSPIDFRSPRVIGDVPINTCYLDPQRDSDGLARVRLSNPSGQKSVTIWLDKGFDYVVLYSGEALEEQHRRRSLAIEAMTCASDAFNHPDWGLLSLAPGQTVSASWGVDVSELR